MDFSEIGPIVFVSLPAFFHEIIDFFGASWWLGEIDLVAVVVIEVTDVFYDFVVHHIGVWLVSGECQYLPHGHCECPDVTLGCEFALKEILKNYHYS